MIVFLFELSQGEMIGGSGKVWRLRILLCKGKNIIRLRMYVILRYWY